MARLLKSLTRQYKAIGCGFTHAAQPSTTIIPLSNHYLLASPKFSSLLMDSNSPDFVASSSCSSTKIQLYSYWQSSCSWRVRFALNLKELPYEYKAVDLSKGEQFSSEFERLNPVHFVPVLVEGDLVVSDSFAILLYLDEKYPQNALLPVDVKKKALNLQVAGIIGSSIQPLHMQSVLPSRSC